MADALDREASQIGRKFRHDREVNDNNLKSRFEEIFQKYEKDFTGIGDEIDLLTGQIIVDNGHLQSMQHEADPGEDSASAFVNTLAVNGEADSDAATPEAEDDYYDEDQSDIGFEGTLRQLSREIDELSENSTYSSSGILTDDEAEDENSDMPRDDGTETSAQLETSVGSTNEPSAGEHSTALPPQINILKNMPAALRDSALAAQTTGAQFDKMLLEQLEQNITGQIAQFLAASTVKQKTASGLSAQVSTVQEAAWKYPELPVDKDGQTESPQASRLTLPTSAALMKHSPRKRRSLWAPLQGSTNKRPKVRAYLVSPRRLKVAADRYLENAASRNGNTLGTDTSHPNASDAAIEEQSQAQSYLANTGRRIASKATIPTSHHDPFRQSIGESSSRPTRTDLAPHPLPPSMTREEGFEQDIATHEQSDRSLDQEEDTSDFTDEGEYCSDEATTGVWYTKREDELMVELRCRQGLPWRVIAQRLPGRNMESLLNRYTYIRRRILPALIAKGEISADHLRPVNRSTQKALARKKLRISTSYRADALRESLRQQNAHQPVTSSTEAESQPPGVQSTIRPTSYTKAPEQNTACTSNSRNADEPTVVKDYVFSIADDRAIRRLRDTENKLFSEIALRFPGTTEAIISDRYFNHVMGKTLPQSNDPSWKPYKKPPRVLPESASQAQLEPEPPEPRPLKSLLPGPVSKYKYTSMMPVRFTQWIPEEELSKARRTKPKQKRGDSSSTSESSHIQATRALQETEESMVRPLAPMPRDAMQPPRPPRITGIESSTADDVLSVSTHGNAVPAAESSTSRALFPSSIPDTEDEFLQSSASANQPHISTTRKAMLSQETHRPSSQQFTVTVPQSINTTTSQNSRDREPYERAGRAETALQMLRVSRPSRTYLELQGQARTMPMQAPVEENEVDFQYGRDSPDASISSIPHARTNVQHKILPSIDEVVSQEESTTPETMQPSVRLHKRSVKDVSPFETEDDASATIASLFSSGVLYGSLARLYQQSMSNYNTNGATAPVKDAASASDSGTAPYYITIPDDVSDAADVSEDAAVSDDISAPNDTAVSEDASDDGIVPVQFLAATDVGMIKHGSSPIPVAENQDDTSNPQTSRCSIVDISADDAVDSRVMDATPAQSKQTSKHGDPLANRHLHTDEDIETSQNKTSRVGTLSPVQESIVMSDDKPLQRTLCGETRSWSRTASSSELPTEISAPNLCDTIVPAERTQSERTSSSGIRGSVTHSSSADTRSEGRASKPRQLQRATSRKSPVVLGKPSRLSGVSMHRASDEAIRRMSSLANELSDDELA